MLGDALLRLGRQAVAVGLLWLFMVAVAVIAVGLSAHRVSTGFLIAFGVAVVVALAVVAFVAVRFRRALRAARAASTVEPVESRRERA